MSRRHRGRRSVVRSACVAAVERLEERRMLAGEFKLIGITGNQQARTGPFVGTDETLYEISYITPGQPTPPALLDGFEDVKPNLPDTVLSVSTTVGVTQGAGSLRVDVPQTGGFWGFRTGNVIEALKAGANRLSYDMTLIGTELNGGSFGGGLDDSYNGYAQVNEIAVVIAAPSGGFIQRNFTTGNATDSSGRAGQWGGPTFDGTRNITWDLTQFTSNGMSLQEFIAANDAQEARIWFPTQGADSNGHVGPMRFYFDNMVLSNELMSTMIGDFEPIGIKSMIKLPFVPDTDAIGFNPDNGLLYRTSGASSYRDNPNRIGYQDNHYMQTVNPFNPTEQTAIFNSTPGGEKDTIDGVVVDTGPYGLPAPRPTFVLPATPRTPEQTDSSFGDMFGPGEYHAARDLAWSSTEKLFYVADETGIYKLTPTGQSTFVGRPAPGLGDPAAGEDDLKGLAFFTVGGQRRLLASERHDSDSSHLLWTIDPATGQKVGEPVVLVDGTGLQVQGVLSLEPTPDGSTLFGIAQFGGDAFARELVTIDPVTGLVTRLGSLGIHMADLAFVVVPPFRVTGSEFVWQSAPPRLRVTFDRPIDESTLTAGDLSVRQLPGGTEFNATEVSYDPTTRTATFTLSATPLADGNYRATLAQGSVTGADGSELSPATADFFVLAGDANHDRKIDFPDLVALAQNYGQSGKTFPEGDFNYDGQVNFTDLVTLAQKYGTNLPGPAAELLAASAAPVTAGVSPTRSAPGKRTGDKVFNTVVPIKKPAPAPAKRAAPARR